MKNNQRQDKKEKTKQKMKLNKGNQQRKSTEVKEFPEKINKINKHQASLNEKKMRGDTNY